MLVQNELKISRILLMDLIEKNKFNPYSLGGVLLNDLTVFRRNCGSLYYSRKQELAKEKGYDLTDSGKKDKVFWFLKPEAYNVEEFEKQIIRRLKGWVIDDSYKEMTQ